eukprot:15432981-Alexandrium_andersonii.AAC.1
MTPPRSARGRRKHCRPSRPWPSRTAPAQTPSRAMAARAASAPSTAMTARVATVSMVRRVIGRRQRVITGVSSADSGGFQQFR